MPVIGFHGRTSPGQYTANAPYDGQQRRTAIRDAAGREAGPHSLSTRSALRKHTASRSTSPNGAVSMNRVASSLSSNG